MNNGDMPAMPIVRDLMIPRQGNSLPNKFPYGLTKREELASRQMAALQAACNGMVCDTSGIQHLADIAIKQADALLAQLEKGGE